MTEAEREAMLLSDLASCLKCRRIVVVLMVRPGQEAIVGDTCPRDREAIVQCLGKDAVRFGRRTPMVSGQPPSWVRPSHDCNAEEARPSPDPEIGWKIKVRVDGKLKDKGGDAAIYDIG